MNDITTFLFYALLVAIFGFSAGSSVREQHWLRLIKDSNLKLTRGQKSKDKIEPMEAVSSDEFDNYEIRKFSAKHYRESILTVSLELQKERDQLKAEIAKLETARKALWWISAIGVSWNATHDCKLKAKEALKQIG